LEQRITFEIWSTNFECKRTLIEHTNWIYAIAVYKNKIVSASRDNTIKIWDIETTKCIKTIQEKEYQTSLAVGSNGSSFFVGSMDKGIRVFDTNTLECVEILKNHNGNVSTLMYAYDTLYSGNFASGKYFE
jgi:F-box/WD-40 domain protein 7